jgi:hypothetical protein
MESVTVSTEFACVKMDGVVQVVIKRSARIIATFVVFVLKVAFVSVTLVGVVSPAKYLTAQKSAKQKMENAMQMENACVMNQMTSLVLTVLFLHHVVFTESLF